MQCRHCGAQLNDDAHVCPNCGGNIFKFKTIHVVLLSVAAFLVVVLLTGWILVDQDVLHPQNWFQKKTQEVTEAAPEEEVGPESVFIYDLRRDSYTASGNDVDAKATQVAAVIGDVKLTNAELQAYYWYGVYNFVTQYESYLSYYGYDLTYLGLDVTKPFDQQSYANTAENWQRVFLENALTEWHKYNALALQGEKDGYQMSAEMTEELNKLIDDANAAWQEDGYNSLDDMVKAECGPLSSADGYLAYMRTFHYGMDYFNHIYESLTPSKEEVKAYFAENEGTLSFTQDTMTYGVRHILIEPEGGTTDASGTTTTYSDEAWEACRVQAQALLDQWKATDGTEAGFATMANEKSTDPGSNTTGGLYDGLSADTNFVTEFKEWYMDSARQVGDYGLVKTVYGYHIMYMSSMDTIWYDECVNLILQDRSQAFVKQCMQDWPITIFDEKIEIGFVNFS